MIYYCLHEKIIHYIYGSSKCPFASPLPALSAALSMVQAWNGVGGMHLLHIFFKLNDGRRKLSSMVIVRAHFAVGPSATSEVSH